MKVYCAWCWAGGTLTPVSEKPDCNESGDSYGGICSAHQAELLRMRPTLTTAEVAERLGVTSRWIVAEIKAGHLLAVKRGGSWWITEADLKVYQPNSVGWPKGRSRRQTLTGGESK